MGIRTLNSRRPKWIKIEFKGNQLRGQLKKHSRDPNKII